MSAPVTINRPKEIHSIVKFQLEANVPFYLEGSPGTVKSAGTHLAAKECGLEVIDFRPSNRSPIDLSGMPTVKDLVTYWTRNSFLPGPDHPPALFFIDELRTATPAMQAALLQILLDGRVNDHIFPPHIRRGAAGNMATDRAMSNQLSTALTSRVSVYEVSITEENVKYWIQDWARWAFKNNISPDVIAFVMFRPNCFYTFKSTSPSAGVLGQQFACPRTLEALSKLHTAGPPKKLAHVIYASQVGPAVATEFLAFMALRGRNLDVQGALLNPSTAPIPEDTQGMYVMASALSRAVDATTFPAGVAYTTRFIEKDFSFFFVMDAIRRNPDLVQSYAYTQWVAEYGDE